MYKPPLQVTNQLQNSYTSYKTVIPVTSQLYQLHHSYTSYKTVIKQLKNS